MTSERVRLLRRVKGQPQQISALAADLKRDKRAVSRDVAALENAGLLKASYTSNTGHGHLKLVESVVQQFKLVATL